MTTATPPGPELAGVVAVSPAMRDLLKLASRLAEARSPSCSRARAAPARTWSRTGCTTRGPRRDGPFIKIHCPSIPEELLESELFGHEKGAFTDARQAKAGKIELAAGGTLYFDQVQDLTPACRPSSCAWWRSAASSAWAARARSRSTCAS